jgi:hypothetical protein
MCDPQHLKLPRTGDKLVCGPGPQVNTFYHREANF